MTDNDIVRRAYLNVVSNPQGGVIGRVKSVVSKRQWVVLRRESGSRPSRIEVYRNEDQSVEPTRVISFGGNALRNIETLESKKAFVLILRDSKSCMFQCSSRADMEDWYRDINHHNSGHSRGSVSSNHGLNPGEIYEVIPDDETFRVRLRKAKTLPFSGPCLLEILRDFERNLFHIAMFTEEELPRLVVKWQIDHIRQYGSNNMAFKFESGSKSSTGVDWFVLDTEPGCAIRIHKSVDYWAKHIVEQVKNTAAGGSTPTDLQRRNTIPSPPRTPDNTHPSKNSLPRGGSHGSAPSPDNTNTYMAINQESRAPASVYAAPDQKVPPGRPAPPPGGTQSNPHSTYMALNPSSMNSPQQTYEGISPRNPGPPRNGPTVNGSSESSVYMGIDPRTRESADKAHYMGLKEARSN